eukprot:4763769-Prymnesium_polylepis.1
MVGAGLELLAQAKKAERQLADDLREAGEQRRCQLKHLAAWCEVVLRSGPGRREALRGLREAREAVYEELGEELLT